MCIVQCAHMFIVHNSRLMGACSYLKKHVLNSILFSGRVLDQTMPEDRIHIKARLVKFSWQRGVKIGNIYIFIC